MRVESFLNAEDNLVSLFCPEGCGVDLTATMATLGIRFEWPPVTRAFQVALVGTPHCDLLRRFPEFAKEIGMVKTNGAEP